MPKTKPTSYPPVINELLRQETTHIFNNEFGERIGEVKKHAIYIKRVKQSDHLMQKLDGWAISDWVLSKLESINVNLIVIYEKTKQVLYVSSVNMYRTYGVKINYEDTQICLPRNYFTKVEIKKIGERVGEGSHLNYSYTRFAVDHKEICNSPMLMPSLKIDGVERCIFCLRDVRKDKKFLSGEVSKKQNAIKHRKLLF